MSRIRTAVVGTGFMGRVHLEALRRVENVDVVEIAATSAAKARAAAERRGTKRQRAHSTAASRRGG